MTAATQSDIEATDLTEHEFEITCQATKNCERSAAWSVWLSHTVVGCAVTEFVCEVHKPEVDQTWAEAMTYQPPTCPRCGSSMSRNLRDNVKWTHL